MLIVRDRVLELPDPPAVGYTLRGYQPGDEKAWVALFEHGDFSEWSVERFDSYLQGPERREGSHAVLKGGSIVAASFASVQPDAENMGRLDFVVSHPDHRGNGLGRVVCTAVMKHLAGRGYGSTVLFTDDWRLPAIGLYLSLGFVPRMTCDDMPARWKAIFRKLGLARNDRRTEHHGR